MVSTANGNFKKNALENQRNYCQKEIRKRSESIVWKEKQNIYKKQSLLQKVVVSRRAKRLENDMENELISRSKETRIIDEKVEW